MAEQLGLELRAIWQALSNTWAEEMTFIASFVLTGELYGVTDNNEIFRWDVDEAKWLKVGEFDRDG
jgi:hypothetical protein